MYKWWLLCVCCALIAACADDDCSAEQRVAIEVAVRGAGHVDKITAQRAREEEECGSFRDPNGEQLYTCWEQGAGVYTVRVYSGDDVRVAEVELEADECHIKERVAIEIDLDEAP